MQFVPTNQACIMYHATCNSKNYLSYQRGKEFSLNLPTKFFLCIMYYEAGKKHIFVNEWVKNLVCTYLPSMFYVSYIMFKKQVYFVIPGGLYHSQLIRCVLCIMYFFKNRICSRSTQQVELLAKINLFFRPRLILYIMYHAINAITNNR